MPEVTAEAWVPVPPPIAFAVSQTTGQVRASWDPAVRRSHLLGATRPAAGVRTFTRSRLGPATVSRYVSYRPPASVATALEKGPRVVESLTVGWRFAAEERDGVPGTHAVWTHTWTARPAWLRPVADPLARRLAGRQLRARMSAYAGACADPGIVHVASATPG